MQQQPVAGPNDFHIEIGPDGVEHLVSGLGLADPPERGPIMARDTNGNFPQTIEVLRLEKAELAEKARALGAKAGLLTQREAALAAREKKLRDREKALAAP